MFITIKPNKMAHLTKEQYIRRNENAAIRMGENKENCSTLNEEQHDLIARICSMRHRIHCDQQSLYNVESANCSEYGEFLMNVQYDVLNAKLPVLKISYDEMAPDSDDRYHDFIDDTDEAEEKNLEAFYEIMNETNNQIEAWLREIDEQHGTSYCPTGILRNF